MHFGFCRAGVELVAWGVGLVPNRQIVKWTRLSNCAQTNIVSRDRQHDGELSISVYHAYYFAQCLVLLFLGVPPDKLEN